MKITWDNILLFTRVTNILLIHPYTVHLLTYHTFHNNGLSLTEMIAGEHIKELLGREIEEDDKMLLGEFEIKVIGENE